MVGLLFYAIIKRVGALSGSEFFLDSPLEDLRQPLAALHHQCSKRIWGLRKDELSYNIHQVMRDPQKSCLLIFQSMVCYHNTHDCVHGCKVLKKLHTVMSFLSRCLFLYKL